MKYPKKVLVGIQGNKIIPACELSSLFSHSFKDMLVPTLLKPLLLFIFLFIYFLSFFLFTVPASCKSQIACFPRPLPTTPISQLPTPPFELFQNLNSKWAFDGLPPCTSSKCTYSDKKYVVGLTFGTGLERTFQAQCLLFVHACPSKFN